MVGGGQGSVVATSPCYQSQVVQHVTQRRTFWCGKCGTPAQVAEGAVNRLTFLVCPDCLVEEGVLSQTFGHFPFEYFDMRIETTGVRTENGTTKR
jgi:hypothetical protein